MERNTICALPAGVPLKGNFYDDNWSKLDWKNGAVTVKVIDPAAKYGVDIEGLSPEIKTIQAYAPPTQKFVAVEHQYNFADPFGKEWGSMDTSMVTLKPGTKHQVACTAARIRALIAADAAIFKTGFKQIRVACPPSRRPCSGR